MSQQPKGAKQTVPLPLPLQFIIGMVALRPSGRKTDFSLAVPSQFTRSIA